MKPQEHFYGDKSSSSSALEERVVISDGSFCSCRALFMLIAGRNWFTSPVFTKFSLSSSLSTTWWCCCFCVICLLFPWRPVRYEKLQKICSVRCDYYRSTHEQITTEKKPIAKSLKICSISPYLMKSTSIGNIKEYWTKIFR